MSQIKPKVLVGNSCVLQKPPERKSSSWWVGFDKKQDQPLNWVTLISRLIREKRTKLKILQKLLRVVSGRRLPSRWNRSWTKERGRRGAHYLLDFFEHFLFSFMERGSVKRNWGRGKWYEIEILDFSEHFTIITREKIFRHEELLDRR